MFIHWAVSSRRDKNKKIMICDIIMSGISFKRVHVVCFYIIILYLSQLFP